MINQTEIKPAVFLKALESLAVEKQITSSEIATVLKESIIKAYTKDDPDYRLEVNIDLTSGNIALFHLLKVVQQETEDFDDIHEILLEDAMKMPANAKFDDYVKKEIAFTSISKNTVRYILQIFKQRVTELSNKKIIEEWAPKVGQVIFAEYEKQEERGGGIVDLVTTKGLLDRHNTLKGEVLKPGEKYWFAIKSVAHQSHGWPIILSRTDGAILKHMLVENIPEIADGTIEIKNITRMAGQKSKVAVISNNPEFDPIGAIVGKQGEKIKMISKVLYGEIIDILVWSEDPRQIVVNAIAPVRVLGINIVEDSEREKSMEVIVDDDYLPNVIGRAGINVKLIARLTGWNIDIKSVSQANEEGIEYARIDLIAQGQINSLHRSRITRKKEGRIASVNSQRQAFPTRSTKAISYTTKVANVDEIEVDLDLPPPPKKRYEEVYQPSVEPEVFSKSIPPVNIGDDLQVNNNVDVNQTVIQDSHEQTEAKANSITTLIAEIDIANEPKRAMKEVKTQATKDKKKKDKDAKPKKSQRKSLDDFALLDFDNLDAKNDS